MYSLGFAHYSHTVINIPIGLPDLSITEVFIKAFQRSSGSVIHAPGILEGLMSRLINTSLFLFLSKGFLTEQVVYISSANCARPVHLRRKRVKIIGKAFHTYSNSTHES